MHFLEGHHIARTHRAAGISSTNACSHTPLRRENEIEPVVRILKVCFRNRRVKVRAKPKVLVEAIRSDEFSRIHFPLGIKDLLELFESFEDLVVVHSRQEFPAGLTVAVLARKRSAITDDEVGRFLDERSELTDAVDCFKIEIQPHMDASLTEVAVQSAVKLV